MSDGRRRAVVLQVDGHEVRIEVRDGGVVQVDGRPFHVRAGPDGAFWIGDPPRLAWAIADGDTRWVFLDGQVHRIQLHRREAARRRTGHHHGSLSAPMPATVRRIEVATGDPVARGDTLVVLEAMKMELPIRAAADGIVEAVRCREGDLVQPGTVLVEIQEDD